MLSRRLSWSNQVEDVEWRENDVNVSDYKSSASCRLSIVINQSVHESFTTKKYGLFAIIINKCLNFAKNSILFSTTLNYNWDGIIRRKSIMTLYFQKYFFESTGHVLLITLKLKDIISYLYVYVHSSILSNYIWAFFIHFIHIVDPKWIYILWPFTKSPKTKDGNNVYVLYGHINSGYLNMRYCWINSYIYRQIWTCV